MQYRDSFFPPTTTRFKLGLFLLCLLLGLVVAGAIKGNKDYMDAKRAKADAILMVDSTAAKLKHLEDSLYSVYSKQ